MYPKDTNNPESIYVHSKYFKTKPITKINVVVKILRTTQGLKEVLPKIHREDKKDDLTGLKRNIIDLDYEDALKTKEITDRFFEKINKLLNALLLGKKDLPGTSENELFAERVGAFNPWMESDFFVDISEEELKELEDSQLKDIFTKLLEEELSGKHKRIVDSFSAREREEFITRLVKEFKLRTR